MKTSELTGAALDWAVARCHFVKGTAASLIKSEVRPYSTDWAQGGPIIEEMTLACNWLRPFATKLVRDTRKIIQCSGDTPLIAAMRCYVASKLGDEIELPEELSKD